MKKFIYILITCTAVVLFTGCTTYKKSVNTTNHINMQVNIEMKDLEYIGEVTGKAEQSFVLGLPIGGRHYYSVSVGVVGGVPFIGSRGMNNALYDAIMQKPNADFLMPFAVDVETHRMFLGSKKIYNVRAKAFKIKTM